MKRDFLSVRDFTREEILESFELAMDMKKDRAK